MYVLSALLPETRDDGHDGTDSVREDGGAHKHADSGHHALIGGLGDLRSSSSGITMNVSYIHTCGHHRPPPATPCRVQEVTHNVTVSDGGHGHAGPVVRCKIRLRPVPGIHGEANGCQYTERSYLGYSQRS